MSLLAKLNEFKLERELKPASERQYEATVRVFLSWANADDMPIEQFTNTKISEFLAAKQSAGRASHYRRSLRSHLKAIYLYSRNYQNCGKIRPVKLGDLCPASWTPEEVAKLVKACDELKYRERDYWRTLIQFAYYTGLNHCDIRRVQKCDIGASGLISFSRSKTGKRVLAAIPLAFVAEVIPLAPQEGPIWPLRTSEEAFRMRIANLVKWAGIPKGTFKRLRKTSGTLVELHSPGQGHRHLGNTAVIFEKHYEDQRITVTPTMPPELELD